MSLFKTILAYVQFFAFIGYGVAMKHAIFKRKTGQYLPDSVITTKFAESERVHVFHVLYKHRRVLVSELQS